MPVSNFPPITTLTHDILTPEEITTLLNALPTHPSGWFISFFTGPDNAIRMAALTTHGEADLINVALHRENGQLKVSDFAGGYEFVTNYGSASEAMAALTGLAARRSVAAVEPAVEALS